MAGEGEKQEGKGFTVQDRRRFSPETGEAREGVTTMEPSERPEQTTETKTDADSHDAQQPFAEINFSTFVISLSTQALMHLGEIADPLTGKVETDLQGSKQVIDILGMLREKTRGNLNNGEEQLLEDVLFDLRMKYVEAVKKK